MTVRFERLGAWLLKRATVLIGVLSVVAILLTAAMVYLVLSNVEQTTDIRRAERASCLTRNVSSPPCKRQARRIVAACFEDKRCRRIIEKGREALRPRKDEPKGVIPQSGPKPSGQLHGPSKGGPPGQLKAPGKPACPPTSRSPKC